MTALRNVILVASAAALAMVAGYVGVPRWAFFPVLAVIVAVMIARRRFSNVSDSTKKN
jgi:hypothetical protein